MMNRKRAHDRMVRWTQIEAEERAGDSLAATVRPPRANPAGGMGQRDEQRDSLDRVQWVATPSVSV